MYHLISTGAPLTFEPQLLTGRAVRISSGPLSGLNGKVIARRGRTLLLVAVHFLNTGVSVEIDGRLLEAVG